MNSARKREREEGQRDTGREPGFYIGRLFGIPVYVSPSWLIVALLITVMFEGPVRTVVDRPASYAVAFAYAVLLYASVFVHELSHAVTARVFGLPVRSVTLNIIGGLTSMDREAATPGRAFLIALAGPLVNLVLAGAGLLLQLTVTLPAVVALLVEALTFANLIVGAFNLLPGLPLDGGHLVRAVVWRITGRRRDGTIAAAWAGRGLAVLTLLAGAVLATDRVQNTGFGWITLIWSALIASFIWVAAGQALSGEFRRARIPSLHARRLARRATLVTPEVPLAEAIRRAQGEQAGALVIVDHDGRPIGLVSERAVQGTPEGRRPWIEVGEVSRRLEPDLTLSADLSGEDLLAAMRSTPAAEYLVVEPGGEVYGVLAGADVDRAFTGGRR